MGKRVWVERDVGRGPEIEYGIRGQHSPGWSRQRHAAGRDLTEPRYHASVARGGPIERSTEMTKSQQRARQNREAVAELARAGHNAADIASRLGLGLSTVYSMMPAETKERRGLTVEDRTLRETVLDLVDARGEYGTSEALLRDVGAIPRWARTDLHSLNHQLRQMAKQGQITMRVRNNGQAASLERIARKGPIPANKTVDTYPDGSVIVQERRPRTIEIEGKTYVATSGLLDLAAETRAGPTKSVEPEPTGSESDWPILAALRERVAADADARGRQDALMDAADRLRTVDPAAADILLERAAYIETAELSDAEREYLRFAESLQADTGQSRQGARTVSASPTGDE
jgi:hypothetical protein